jgi:hypothetical protein
MKLAELTQEYDFHDSCIDGAHAGMRAVGI